jgi:molybdate transport system substrate-binding protein
MISRSVLAALSFVLLSPIGTADIRAAEINVLSANALKEPLTEIFKAFETKSGHRIIPSWAGTEAAAKRIQDGETHDIVVIGAENLERLIAEGKVVSQSYTRFASSGVGVAVRNGLPRPDISSANAVKAALLAAKSIAYSQGPSGVRVARIIEKLGIADAVKEKIRRTPSGVQVGAFVAEGGADLGFQQISELVRVKGIHYLGPLPPELQDLTIYAAGINQAAPAPDAARELLRFLVSPEAEAALRKTSLQPAS